MRGHRYRRRIGRAGGAVTRQLGASESRGVEEEQGGDGTRNRLLELRLTLYVAGAGTVRSLTAKRRLDQLAGAVDAPVTVEVVDVLDDPERADRDGILATPTLVGQSTRSRQRVVGDLAGVTDLAAALGLYGSLRTSGGEQ